MDKSIRIKTIIIITHGFPIAHGLNRGLWKQRIQQNRFNGLHNTNETIKHATFIQQNMDTRNMDNQRVRKWINPFA